LAATALRLPAVRLTTGSEEAMVLAQDREVHEAASADVDGAHHDVVVDGAHDDVDRVDEILVEEISIDGMCGVY
jgi:mycofactocin precursor